MTLLFIFILNILSLIFCQFDSEAMSKALACMTVISQKLNSNQPEIYSSMMLKCYITITESMSKKILVGLETGTNSLSNKEIDKLTDYMSLSSLSEKELKRKSQELEKILKNFKKLQEDFNGQMPEIGDDDGDYFDEDGPTETPSNVNYFSLIPKGIFGVFNIFNNYLSLFIFLLIIYLTLLMIRKINDSERKMKKKKKKKMMAKKVENDDEDDDENNENDEDSEHENPKKYKKI